MYRRRYKQNARIGERDERSGLFPLPYAVCGCSANMALTDLIGRRRIGPQRRHFAGQQTVPEQAASVWHCITILLQRQRGCVAEACDDGLQRITVCLRCDPALRVARRRLSLFITGGFSPLAVEFTTSAVAFVAFFDADKGSYKHTVFWTFHNYFSPWEGSFLWTFCFIPSHFPAPFRRGSR